MIKNGALTETLLWLGSILITPPWWWVLPITAHLIVYYSLLVIWTLQWYSTHVWWCVFFKKRKKKHFIKSSFFEHKRAAAHHNMEYKPWNTFINFYIVSNGCLTHPGSIRNSTWAAGWAWTGRGRGCAGRRVGRWSMGRRWRDPRDTCDRRSGRPASKEHRCPASPARLSVTTRSRSHSLCSNLNQHTNCVCNYRSVIFNHPSTGSCFSNILVK